MLDQSVQDSKSCQILVPKESWEGVRPMRHIVKRGSLKILAAASILLVLPISVTTVLAANVEITKGPVIHISDVSRFYKVYDAAHGHPTAAELQLDYLDPGTPGLHHLAKIRRVSGKNIAAEIAAHPKLYAHARRCMAILPQVRHKVTTALRRLGRFYPKAVFPPVTIAISHGKPVGVADSTGVMIGLEGLCAVRYLNPDIFWRFVHTISHEYIHVQQAVQSPALYGNPKPTVLDASLIEGAAEFLATLIAHERDFRSPYAPEDRAHDKIVEIRFVADENQTDLSHWIDNGTLTKPGNLGYWVGYRIVKSYYEHAASKPQAVRSILQMKSPKVLLAKSGWYPGIHLWKMTFHRAN